MKKSSIQIKVGFLMFLAVSLLSAAGYLSYRNISSIVASIKVDENPEQRLLSIRDISLDLEKAQSSVRIYSVTGNNQDIKPYYKIISGIDKKVTRLRSQCATDSMLLRQTDTISRLIEENIIIWNRILNLNNDNTVVENLKQLSDSLVADTMDAGKAEKGFFQRVFGRNTKTRIDEKALLSNLQAIKVQDSINKEKLRWREFQLAATGSKIKNQFYDLMARIEEETTMLVNTKAAEADQLAGKTYRWLAIFSVSGTLLAILVMFIIFRYVRKTHLYQIALKRSKEETEKLARIKELFIANMSHEIRTPVTAISGFAGQLLHEHLDENATRTVNIIKSSSDHLVKIINDILDFSKLQNDKVVLEKLHFSIANILNDIYLLFEKQALQNNIMFSYSLSPETPPVLLGDPYRLKQILMNLISNSIKFTKDGKVHVSVKGTLNKSLEIDLIIEVLDTGIGIDESKIKLIFDDFTQEEMSTTRKYGGTGLGLSIVKKLIELQNGSIDCKSRKNQGTQITCHIPYLKGDADKIEKDTLLLVSVPEAIRKLNVLVVDDEEYNRLLFKSIFERWDVKFRSTDSGQAALDLLKIDKFDLLFIDVRMPVMDGLEVMRIIRAEMKISKSVMPAICISAVSVNEERQKILDGGMDAFLSKPFTEELLLTTMLSVIKEYGIENVIKGRSAGRAISSELPKVNFQNLYHLAGGDNMFVKQMLESFLDTTGSGLKEMEAAVNLKQADHIAELSHKLLPPCRHVGAKVLVDLLKNIENSSKNGSSFESIEAILKESVIEFEKVRLLIREETGKIS